MRLLEGQQINETTTPKRRKSNCGHRDQKLGNVTNVKAEFTREKWENTRDLTKKKTQMDWR